MTEMTDVISTDAPRIEFGCERIGINPSLPLFIALRIIKWMIDVCLISLNLDLILEKTYSQRQILSCIH